MLTSRRSGGKLWVGWGSEVGVGVGWASRIPVGGVGEGGVGSLNIKFHSYQIHIVK